MYKIKTSLYYLERGFPENLEPAFTNRSTKRKRSLVRRKRNRLKRIVRQGYKTLAKPFFEKVSRQSLEPFSSRDQVLVEQSKDFLKDVVKQIGQENRHNDADQLRSHQEVPLKDSIYKVESGLTFSKCQAGRDLVDQDVQNRKEPEKRTTFDTQRKRSRRYQFLFPLHRLVTELSKRESQYGKKELYKKVIQEKKKMAWIYGIKSRNSIKKLVERALALSSSENPPTKTLVTLLESRLDVALFRASFFPSISQARQWISHNKVTVNQNKIRAPGYQLKGGDCIEILPVCAPVLKEKLKERIGQILPFRGSRKKVVSPSLIENWCSFENLFSWKESPEKLWTKGQNLVSFPSLDHNFSQMRNHLLSMWQEDSTLTKRLDPFWNKGKKPFKKKHFLSPHQGHFDEKGLYPWIEKTSSPTQNVYSPAFSKRNKESNRIVDRKSKMRNLFLQRANTFFARLKKKEANILDFLNAKKKLVQSRHRRQKLAALQVSPMKPLHLEVSYRLMTAIFLYSPQKVAYPCSLDFSLIIRSLK